MSLSVRYIRSLADLVEPASDFLSRDRDLFVRPRIVVPTALPGIISGVLLALARVMGETAPVLVLVGYARSINYDPLNGNMASLPLLIYTELINPEAAGRLRVWGAALTLIMLVAALYVAAAFINRYLNRNRA